MNVIQYLKENGKSIMIDMKTIPQNIEIKELLEFIATIEVIEDPKKEKKDLTSNFSLN